MISQPKSRKSLVFLTILLLPVKIRKPVFILVNHLSVLVRCSEHPEDITIPFHRVHSVGHQKDGSSCSVLPHFTDSAIHHFCSYYFLHIIFQTLVSSLQTVQAVHPCGDNIFHSCPALQSVPFLHLLMQNQRYPYCP